MADSEDADKAEKLAAAKKRFEQLKKQKAKKTPGTKKATEDSKAKDTTVTALTGDKEKGLDPNTNHPEAVTELRGKESGASEPNVDLSTNAPVRQSHNREPSLSIQSRLRSDSFRRAVASGSSPTASPVSATVTSALPLAAVSYEGDAVQDIYRKQAARLETLERENKRLEQELADHILFLQKSDAELEELQDTMENVPMLKAAAARAEAGDAEIEKLRMEISSLQRQNSQLQSQISAKRRTSFTPASIGVEDLNVQLASKSSTIDALELEGSNLRHQMTSLVDQNSTLSARVETLESALQQADQRADNVSAELTALKTSLDAASQNAAKEGSERSSAETRIILLESDLKAAQKAASDAVASSVSFEKKIETLRTLHKESESRNQTQSASRSHEIERCRQEANDLRAKLGAISNENARLRESTMISRRANVDGDDGGIEELEDEERDKLVLRLRDLEKENFELRRGIWRDRRKEMQPPGDGDDSGSPGLFDDVDLSASTGVPKIERTKSVGSASYPSAFQTVFSAFTGQRGQDVGIQRTRRDTYQSHGHLSDDGSITFDEDAFRTAQEEEAKGRIERVRELKRALKQWDGWRLDLVESRGGAMAGVFDV